MGTNLNMHISLALRVLSEFNKAVALGWLTGNIAPTTEMSVETVERIIKLLQEKQFNRKCGKRCLLIPVSCV